MRKYDGPLFWFTYGSDPQYIIAASSMGEAQQKAALWDVRYGDCGEVTEAGREMPPGMWVYLDGDAKPVTRKLFASSAEGERYVVPAATKEEADGVMSLVASQQGMTGYEPCILLDSYEAEGHTIWVLPD
jgi:hypothetical protein